MTVLETAAALRALENEARDSGQWAQMVVLRTAKEAISNGYEPLLTYARLTAAAWNTAKHENDVTFEVPRA